MRRIISGLLVLGLIGAIGCIGLYVYFHQQYWTAPQQQTGSVELFVPSGTSSSKIISMLEQEGIITHPTLFKLFAMKENHLSAYKAGEYGFNAPLSPQDVSRILVQGSNKQRSITIPEGWLSEQIVAELNKHEFLTGEIHSTPPEGSILPETYFYMRGDTRQSVIDTMQVLMQKTLNSAWENRQPDLPLASKEEALILASIVEKETSADDLHEQRHVAGVFINRLRKGMKLQSDPTANYGLYLISGTLKKRMLRKDVQHVSEYNTYVIPALPPSPICNPGKDSIEAVLNPLTTKDLFFVADGKGGHNFAATLAEHNRNVAQYRAWLKQQK